jgi:hypothetical protein
MLVLSVALLIRSFRSGEEKGGAAARDSSKRLKLIGTGAALFLFVAAFPHLCFLIPTLPLMIFLTRVIGVLSWRVSLAIGLSTSLAMYALFKIWLKVQFPAGPWGF